MSLKPLELHVPHICQVGGRRVAAIVGVLACAGQAWAQASPDATLEAATRLIRKAVVAAREGSITQNADAGQIITALRSSHDKGLLPLFAKVAESKAPENKIYGMVAAAILSKKAEKGEAGSGGGGGEGGTAAKVDIDLLLKTNIPDLVGPAIGSLIDADAIPVEGLKRILAESREPSHRTMAAAELDRLHKLDDRQAIKTLLNDPNRVVRYYAANILLSSHDPAEVDAGLAVLKEMTADKVLREAPAQALMLVRLQKEKLAAGIPWALQMASDPGFDEGLRYTAVSTLLDLKAPEGAAVLGQMIQSQHEFIQQVKLGLVALEHAGQLSPAMLQPLAQSKSRLAKAIALIAQKEASHVNGTADLLALIKDGDPIVLDWASAYAEHVDAEAQVAIRTALVHQATIVDNVRDNDYERAAVAVERMLDNNATLGRQTVAKLLQSDNRAVVEATLAGIYRSEAKNQSELVTPIWEGLTKITSAETSANYAALILAREGHAEALPWLPGMVAGGTVQGPGFRALASWYYAKLKGETEVLLKAVLAE